MNLMNKEYRSLLAGVDTNDPAAVARWRQETDDHMVYVVARVLRRGTEATPLDRRVLAAARVVAWQYPQQAQDRDWLAQQVAGNLSRDVLTEALAPSGGQSHFETVCA
jgi:hypothetical protein